MIFFRFIFVSGCFILTSCGGGLEDQAKQGLAPILKDASSAQFIELRKDSSGMICGQVNSKNSYGAYAGYSYFYVWNELAFVDDESQNIHLARDMCKNK